MVIAHQLTKFSEGWRFEKNYWKGQFNRRALCCLVAGTIYQLSMEVNACLLCTGNLS